MSHEIFDKGSNSNSGRARLGKRRSNVLVGNCTVKEFKSVVSASVGVVRYFCGKARKLLCGPLSGLRGIRFDLVYPCAEDVCLLIDRFKSFNVIELRGGSRRK